MRHEKPLNTNPENAWENLESQASNEIYANLGKSAIGAAESNNFEKSHESELKSMEDEIRNVENQLLSINNELTLQANELWRQLENKGFRPNSTSEYRELEQNQGKTINEAVDLAYQNLIDKFSPRMSDRELGKLFGEAFVPGASSYINNIATFHHLSKEGKLGVMESFDLYDYDTVFKEKGVDIYEQINEKVFDGQLTDDSDMQWSIMPASILDKDEKRTKGIAVNQIFREEQYDENGNWEGDQWFSGDGSILINLKDFSDVKLFGRCTKEQREMLGVAKKSNAKNVFDLIEGGAEALTD